LERERRGGVGQRLRGKRFNDSATSFLVTF
jgi:hypothetical protein